jgi:hypothetical protein
MEPQQICELGPGTSVWVWIVRMGKGRWWPGSVVSVAAREPFPIVNARFECRSSGKNGSDGPAFVGISTTRVRYLELRDPYLKDDDRPNFVPSAILAKPEKTEVGLNGTEHPDAIIGDDQAARVSPPSNDRKHRSRRKAKLVRPTEDESAVAD